MAQKDTANAQLTYVALLRGINVGGKNLLPMKALIAMFEQIGCSDVRNYIQSGNIVFQSSNAAQVSSLISKSIQDAFGFSSPVILRSAAEIASVSQSNPFPDLDKTHVLFLADEPKPGQVATLDPERGGHDRYAVLSREIYLFTPNGLGNTKLTNAYFDSRLKTISTVRNWRTVLKLLEMTG